MIESKKDHQLIIKYLQGKTTEEENQYIKVWVSSSVKNQEEFEVLSSIWQKTEPLETPPQNDPELIWGNINRDINRKVLYKETEFDYSIFIKAAAAIVVIITAFLLYNHSQIKYGETIEKKSLTETTQKHVAVNRLITHFGERATCVLPDSTVVHLNSESCLSYPVGFSGEKRIVTLEGEAYFSVRPDKTRPFIVKTGNSEITVTGTEFNVRNRNKNINVAVSRGSVNVKSLNSLKEENLKRGEMAQLDKTGILTNQKNVNLRYILAWRENKLAFRHSSLSEVMSEIQRTFNVAVEFRNNSVKERTLTGIFETDSLEKILSILSVTLDINISQRGTKIIIN